MSSLSPSSDASPPAPPTAPSHRPLTSVVFAISADGKIGDDQRSRARLGSKADRRYLEEQVARADAVLMGAGTLRSEGYAMGVYDPALIQAREDRGQSPQPAQIIASASGAIAPDLGFFQQDCPRWLLTTPQGAERWGNQPGFDRILIMPTVADPKTAIAPVRPEPARPLIDWSKALGKLKAEGIAHLAILGGGTLVAALLAIDAIDEWHVTLCPLLIGGENAPTPVDGSQGFPASQAPRLRLKSVRPAGDEVFLYYVRAEDSLIAEAETP
ncbi:MAG: RibD family protein [Cyanobacteria bacterium P01_H01_bin.130]